VFSAVWTAKFNSLVETAMRQRPIIPQAICFCGNHFDGFAVFSAD
jgi:hypothetical protein